MQEKKLTDEERAIGELNAYRNRYYAEPTNTEKSIIANAINDIFNLIHRLQSENERLTEEKEGWEKSCKLWSGANKSNHLKFSRTLEKLCEERNKNAELQKQVESWKAKSKELETAWDIASSNEEKLQEQVDELKERFLETCENCHLKKDLDLLRYQKQQAVKDTAKEIYSQVLEWLPVGEDYHWFITTLENWIKERYGVEVE